jgi:2-aminoethylphosphonate-pyruvate transaminase
MSGFHAQEVRTAVILAAGMGVRLKDRGKLTPKGLLCLGETSIVEESVLRLLSAGIERIVIVTGYLAERYEPLRDRYPQTIQLVQRRS